MGLRLLCLLIISSFVFGCVSKSKYEDLRMQNEAELATLQKRLKDAQSQLDQSQTLAAQLEEKLGSATSDKESMKKSVAEMKQALKELAERKRETEKRVEEYKNLVKKFKSLTDAGQLKIKIVDGRMVVVLPSDVLFPSGSSSLSEKGVKTIKQVGSLLNSIPGKMYQIEGHTDSDPISTSKYPSNWELASARALTVTKVMLESGLSGDRISAASFGKFKPTVDNETKSGKAANRRIEIVIVPDLSTLPGYDELKQYSDK